MHLSKDLDPPISNEDYSQVFGNPIGARVLDDLKAGFFFDTQTFEPGIDPLHMAWREGQRSVVLWLLHTVAVALEKPDEVPVETTQPE